MFAGNFLGDVARRVLLKLAQKGVLFSGLVTDGLKTKDSITATDVVEIERS